MARIVPERHAAEQGSHILFPLDLFPTDDAMLSQKTRQEVCSFAVPWGGACSSAPPDGSGSCDDLYVTEKRSLTCSPADKYLTKPLQLRTSGRLRRRTPLVSAVEGREHEKIARDDVIEVDPTAALSASWGRKVTTHRAMAEDTINCGSEALESQLANPNRAHVLHGGDGFTSDLWEKPHAYLSSFERKCTASAARFGTAAKMS